MPAPRSGIDGEATVRTGFMQPVVPRDPGRVFNAIDVDCPKCTATAGHRCGPRFCPERIEMVRLMASSGELPGEVISDRPKECPDCHRRRNQTGRKWLACAEPSHRCTAMDHGSRCSGAVETGTDKCEKHAAVRPASRPRFNHRN